MRRVRNEAGQAALVLVLSIVLLLATSGSLLAVNAWQHDPLVQADVVQHYAYRALEAGVNSYLSTINAEPSLVNCNTTSTSSTCAAQKYDVWSKVPTTLSTAVPQYYLWTNPQLCFSTTATRATSCTSSPASGNLEYAQVLVVGAAGTPGHFQYQQSVTNFSPKNGFLTHLWWSNYEAEPNAKTAPRTACQYDYRNQYAGPGSACTAPGYAPGVYFGPGDVIDGPVFTNDSIYVATDPTFGTPSTHRHLAPIETADPTCLVVTDPLTGGTSAPPSCQQSPTSRAVYTTTNSRNGVPRETPPSTDTNLETLAAQGGCVYTGPTTISFLATSSQAAGHKVGYMNVYSPETPIYTTDGHTYDANNTRAKNHNQCIGTDIRVPDGTPGSKTGGKGNGVIYVKTNAATSSCTQQDANPYDAYVGTVTTERAQIQRTGANRYNMTDTTGTVNCAGDAFVHDANHGPAGRQSGFAGNLTVAAQNNVVITGPLHYTNCGSAFSGKAPCPYHDGAAAVNDSLGLIANNFVVLNRPVCPSQQSRYYSYYRQSSTDPYCARSGLMKRCAAETSASTWTTWQDALCNPGPTIQVDAAILALNHSFTVDNYTAGGTTGKLVFYGAMAQYWRGEVGVFGFQDTGYSKYYTWDSRLQYVSIPYYLTPGTTSWGIASSSVVLSNTCPAWPTRFPTGFGYVKTKIASTTTTLRTSSTHASKATAPTGAPCT